MWLAFDLISVPQKSLRKASFTGVPGRTSLFFIMASESSKAKVPQRDMKWLAQAHMASTMNLLE